MQQEAFLWVSIPKPSTLKRKNKKKVLFQVWLKLAFDFWQRKGRANSAESLNLFKKGQYKGFENTVVSQVVPLVQAKPNNAATKASYKAPRKRKQVEAERGKKCSGRYICHNAHTESALIVLKSWLHSLTCQQLQNPAVLMAVE